MVNTRRGGDTLAEQVQKIGKKQSWGWVAVTLSKDLRILVKSSGWLAHTDTFSIFAENIDDDFVTRFMHKKWVEDDRFIAIAPIDDYPSWMVVSNYLERNSLAKLLTNLIPK